MRTTAPDAGVVETPKPPPAPKASVDPNDPFAPYPGSQELCNRLVVAEGKPLHWRSWVTPDDWSKVCDHYKDRTKGMPITQGTDKLEIHAAQDRVMVIYPRAMASAHPQCDKPLSPEDKTVIMVSEMRMPR